MQACSFFFQFVAASFVLPWKEGPVFLPAGKYKKAHKGTLA